MPRAFTSDETELIRARLQQAGTEAFASRGLRGTTVDELARAAAISKGAFYRFYDSKEALLMALLEDHEVAMHAELEAVVRADPVGGLDVLVDAAVHAMVRHPLLGVLMTPEGARVLQSCPPEQQARLRDRDERLVARVTSALQEAGIDLTVPPRVLLGLLRSLVFAGLHRDEIGPDLIEDVSSWLKQTLRAATRSGSGG